MQTNVRDIMNSRAKLVIVPQSPKVIAIRAVRAMHVLICGVRTEDEVKKKSKVMVFKER